MRLIDADALMAEITEENPMVHFGPFGYCGCSPNSDFGEKVFMRDRVLEIVESAPTVDSVVMPCKLGDPVFIIGGKYRAGRFEQFINPGKFRLSDLEKVGKTVFLTREEAEAALAKMKGGAENA